MPAFQTPTNKSQNFISSILQKLPYVSAELAADDHNPKYELFHRLSKRTDYRLLRQSVITGPAMQDPYNQTSGTIQSNNPYHQYIYAKLDTDKIRRLAEYRRMASFSEVSDCLDEICDSFIVKDDNGKVINLKFSSSSEMSSEERDELKKEFEK